MEAHLHTFKTQIEYQSKEKQLPPPHVSLIEDVNSIAYSSSSSQDDKITYEFVDMGLSVKWATCNIGARTPEENGWYFQWAGTTAYRSDYRAVDDESNIFTWKNAPYLTDDSLDIWALKFSKYTSNDKLGVLESKDDAAYIHMGKDWRMPTLDEYKELVQNCDISSISNNNTYYIKFTLKSNPSKELIFPFAGFLDNGDFSGPPMAAYYWIGNIDLKELSLPSNAFIFMAEQLEQIYDFDATVDTYIMNDFRSVGCSVRGVYTK